LVGALGEPANNDEVLIRDHLLDRMVCIRKSGQERTEYTLDRIRTLAIGESTGMVDDILRDDVINVRMISAVDRLFESATGRRLILCLSRHRACGWRSLLGSRGQGHAHRTCRGKGKSNSTDDNCGEAHVFPS
jgi:hypothetical protein